MEACPRSGPVMLQGVVFDAYGTLFDVYGVGALAERHFPGSGSKLALLWREKQIEYTRLRTLSDRYVPFSRVTRDALKYACLALGCDLSDIAENALMSDYGRLPVFADARETLLRLRAMGLETAILSNGDPGMVSAVVDANRMSDLFDHVLSVDAVRRFKTAPEAYAIAPQALKCKANDLLFVSSNGWDACGATWYGYRTVWVNRQGLPLEELGVAPDRQVCALSEVVSVVEELSGAAERSDAMSPPPAEPSTAKRADRVSSSTSAIRH